MVIKAVGLDIQGTLVVPAIKNIKTEKIMRPAVDGNNSEAFINAFSAACFSEESDVPEWEVVPAINGVSEEDTFQKLAVLAANGVALYLTSGDGKESTHREPGSLGVIEVQALFSSHGIPTTIVNWEVIKANGLDPEKSVGKNLLLEHAANMSQAQNGEVLFIDDGLKLINHAKDAGYQAMHVNAPQDLTAALQYALDNSLKTEVTVESAPKAAQSAPCVSPNLLSTYQTLPQQFRIFLSETTQAARHALTNAEGKHPSTEDYWVGLSAEKQAVLKMKHQYHSLSEEYRMFLSETTQEARHVLTNAEGKHPCTEDYWIGLNAEKQADLRSEFDSKNGMCVSMK